MRTIGGIGYILSLIPLVNIAAPILVGIAWLQMGGRTGTRVFKATGVLMLIQFAASIAFFITFPILILSSLFLFPSSPLAAGSFSEDMTTELLKNVLALVILGVVVGAIAIAAFILELISHFRAAGIFNVKWFRYAAWLRIASIIAAIAFIAVVALGIGISMARATEAEPAAFPLEAPLIGGLVAMLTPVFLGIIFSAIAFFKIPETHPAQTA